MLNILNNDKIFNLLNKSFLIFLLVIVIYPLIYIISASISDPTMVNTGQMWLWPKDITFEGYERIFQNRDIWIGYRNTIFYTLAATAVNLFVTLPAAYALSRKDFIGRHIFMMIFVFTMFFQGGLVPTYLLVRDLGLIDTVWAMILPTAASVWNIIVTRTFFQATIPRGLEEAAEIDGCSQIKLFIKIIMPLSAPIIAVMALFYGVGHWNQYFNAMIYLKDRDLYPLQLILREILVLNEMGEGMISATNAEAQAEQARIADIVKYGVIIISTLPIILIYPFLQRFFLKGVMIGSLKE